MKRSLLFHALVVYNVRIGLEQCRYTASPQQNSVALDAKTDAEYDAENDVNTALWLAAGGILGTAGSCLLGSICTRWCLCLSAGSAR